MLSLRAIGASSQSVWERLGGLMGVRQRRSRRFPTGCRCRAERCPSGSLPLRVVLSGFAFGVVGGGV